jgi:MFS family permease
MSKATGTPPAPTSTWSALRHAPFRTLWQSGSLYFVANAMQTMAAAWMKLPLTGSSVLAALVQTAVFLPMFLLSLPAGVLADITDRRRLILGALALQAATGTRLAAMLSPAWNSTVADSIPRDELPNAITAVAIAYNGARALGPALAGVVFTLGNGAWNFVIAVLGALAMLQGIRSWPPKPHSPSRLPAERLWGGMLAGLRFARHSQTVLAQLVRTVAYSGAGSALWALLPVIGQRQLGLGAAGVGLLMGCMGGGAVVAGLVIGRLRARAGLEGLVALGCVLYAGAMLVAAFSTQKALVYPALGLGGACWMAVMSTFNTATQTSVPLWVRARALAMHTLCALGSFAICSAFWGALSDITSLSFALSVAAACMAAGLLLARPFPLRMGEAEDVTLATRWDDFFVADEPAPEAGPVAVELGYRVAAEHSEQFLDALAQLRAPRKRDGATFWRAYRDLSDPSRYVERFIVTSWADYLHQRSRATLADQELEQRVRSYLLPGETVSMQHFIAER